MLDVFGVDRAVPSNCLVIVLFTAQYAVEGVDGDDDDDVDNDRCADGSGRLLYTFSSVRRRLDMARYERVTWPAPPGHSDGGDAATTVWQDV